MDRPWLVIFRKSYTQQQVGPVERFATREAAESRAFHFNRASQDHTWNAVVAVTHNSSEQLRG